jgi:transcriptional regulator with XRE-family HTH domain
MPDKIDHSVPRNPEAIGKRIARLRTSLGWTQQMLADRLAISRVAVSHIEMDLTIPGERTITLLAGIFKMTPAELVQHSTYPDAKAERLPLNVCSYTPLEVELALLENDLKWLEKVKNTANFKGLRAQMISEWRERLLLLLENNDDDCEKEALRSALKEIKAIEI